jgi:hypothetical protein
MSTDKLTDHEDWKDGMNAFRLKMWEELTHMWEELTHLQEEINKINNKLKETL